MASRSVCAHRADADGIRNHEEQREDEAGDAREHDVLDARKAVVINHGGEGHNGKDHLHGGGGRAGMASHVHCACAVNYWHPVIPVHGPGPTSSADRSRGPVAPRPPLTSPHLQNSALCTHARDNTLAVLSRRTPVSWEPYAGGALSSAAHLPGSAPRRSGPQRRRS